MIEPHIRALLACVRTREAFRFTTTDGDRGGIVVGVAYVGGRWTPRFDPLDQEGWAWHWLGLRAGNRASVTRPLSRAHEKGEADVQVNA